MPGPPFGPSYLITTTSPFTISPFLIASLANFSESKTLAVPSKKVPSFPVIFATLPSLAKFPYKILIWPVFFIGSEIGFITFWFSSKDFTLDKFSEIVFPVTVMQSGCNMSLSSINFKTAGTPPTLCKSSIKYFPLGFKSAKKGVSLEIFWKSFRSKSILAVLHIAKICNTALVDPPSTVISLTAFSIALLFKISDGLMSFSNRLVIEFAIIFFSWLLSLLIAGFDEL